MSDHLILLATIRPSFKTADQRKLSGKNQMGSIMANILGLTRSVTLSNEHPIIFRIVLFQKALKSAACPAPIQPRICQAIVWTDFIWVDPTPGRDDIQRERQAGPGNQTASLKQKTPTQATLQDKHWRFLFNLSWRDTTWFNIYQLSLRPRGCRLMLINEYREQNKVMLNREQRGLMFWHAWNLNYLDCRLSMCCNLLYKAGNLSRFN